jgi:hypothetical protein
MLSPMRVADFLVETLAYFAKEIDGPPPGVPLHIDARFETELVAICQYQRLGTLVSESFDRLALPPTVSRITIARINQQAEEMEAQRRERLRTLQKVLAAFNQAGVRVAVLGDAWTAAGSGDVARLRPVERIDLMIDERDWMEAVQRLRGLGFTRSRIQPRLAEAGPSGPNPHAVAAALRYHHYFAPLVMHDAQGDAVALRFRVIDFGHPGRTNPAWERVCNGEVSGEPARFLSREDQLLHALVTCATEGFADLLPVLDAGLVVARYRDVLDWRYVTDRARKLGLYPACYFTVEHVCDLLGIGLGASRLEAPPRWRRRLFHAWWRPLEADVSGATEPTGGRFGFYLIECRGLVAKLLWLTRSVFPPAEWVRSVYGRPANPWLRLKFLFDVRSGWRRKGPPAPESGHDATHLTRSR